MTWRFSLFDEGTVNHDYGTITNARGQKRESQSINHTGYQLTSVMWSGPGSGGWVIGNQNEPLAGWSHVLPMTNCGKRTSQSEHSHSAPARQVLHSSAHDEATRLRGYEAAGHGNHMRVSRHSVSRSSYQLYVDWSDGVGKWHAVAAKYSPPASGPYRHTLHLLFGIDKSQRQHEARCPPRSCSLFPTFVWIFFFLIVD